MQTDNNDTPASKAGTTPRRLVPRDQTDIDNEALLLLHSELSGALRGDERLDIDIQAQPELHAAVDAAKTWIESYRANPPKYVTAKTVEVLTTGEKQLIDIHRNLPDHEQQRVFNAVSDAAHRQYIQSEAYNKTADVLESFDSWLESVNAGETVGTICFRHDLTKRQHRQYIKAYTILATVHTETETRFALRNLPTATDEEEA